MICREELVSPNEGLDDQRGEDFCHCRQGECPIHDSALSPCPQCGGERDELQLKWCAGCRRVAL